jgi:multicomponent Na+:H+ antiporter subunit E
MLQFLFNVGLAGAWAALMGAFDAATLAAGFAVGYAVLWAVQPALGPSAYVRGLWRTVAFVIVYLADLVRSSVRVAIDVCRPTLGVCPGVVGVPLRARTDAEIAVLANLISLTPGTLSLDVSADRRVLYVHAMDLDGGPDALRRTVREGLEDRVLLLLRGAEAGAPDASPAGPSGRRGPIPAGSRPAP